MAHVDFSAIINDFLTAELGEDVRDSLVAIAEALQEAINTQIASVTTDVDSTDPNAAIRASVLGDFMARTPYYTQELRPGTAQNPTSLDFRSPSLQPLNITDATRDGYDTVPSAATGYSWLVTLANRVQNIVAQVLICPLVGIWTRRFSSASGWNSWRGGVDTSLSQVYAAADARTVGQEFQKAIRAAGLLHSTDLNTITTNSVYALDAGTYTYTNAPTGISGVLYLITTTATDTSGWQVLYGSVGRMWTRRKTASGWDAWYKPDNAISERVDSLEAAALTVDGFLRGGDLNDITTNSVYACAVSSYTYTNLPDGASGVMYLTTMIVSDTSGWQVLYGSVGRMWTRRKTASGWDAWYKIGGDGLTVSSITITSGNKARYFTDCDNAPLNTAYRIDRDAKLAHTPYGDGMSTASGVYDGTYRDIAGYADGTLMTYGQSNDYKHQLFISGTRASTAPPDNAVIFFRTYYSGSSGWGAWHCVSNYRSPTASNIAIRKKFIAPWLDDQGKPTATDTGVPNPQYIADDPLFFNDFDDAPFNSIYQIDLDNDATVMAHNPRPGKSSVLVTTGFSWVGMQHGKIQLCIGVDAGTTFFYVRYGYIQSASQGIYIWTDWLHVGDAGEVDALKARVAALETQVAALGG